MEKKNTMQLIKELRERTNAAMVDCKKALEASDWDVEKAIVWLQENGKAKAAKKAGRVAAEGLVGAATNEKAAVIFEVNSETDFVALNKQFVELVQEIGQILLNGDFSSDEEALKLKNAAGKTIAELTEEATATIGEKITFRRAIKHALKENEVAGAYVHVNGRVASLVIVEGKDKEAARNVSMHVSAMNPEFTLISDVPAEKVESLRAEFEADETLKSKPEQIRKSIVEGKISKSLSDFVLEAQEFVMDSAFRVGKYLESKGNKLVKTVRFEVGEGIEKVETDFAAEVAAQVAEATKK